MIDEGVSAPDRMADILVLAPFGKDQEFLERLLIEHELPVRLCPSARELDELLTETPAVLLLTHEALRPSVLELVADHLAAQPPWAEMPVVVLLDRSAPEMRIRDELMQRWPGARLIFHRRPVTPLGLVSGLQSAMLTRLRQREVRDYIERETVLRHELNHRVKNILTSVTSMFQMTLRGATSLDGFVGAFSGRLDALSKVHAAVFEASERQLALREIAELTLRPYRHADGANLAIAGPEIMLGRENATTLALCLHELATNALKYGALSRPGGRVELSWEIIDADPPNLALRWREAGGPPAAPPSGSGYGTRYIQAALAGLFGQRPRLHFDAAGFRCEVQGLISRVERN